MPCVPLPALPLPTLPAPLSFSLPTIATPQLSENFCCVITIPSIPLPLPPLGLGFLGAAATVAIQGVLTVMGQVQAFVASLQINCPLQ
jgi:hypothetical protein